MGLFGKKKAAIDLSRKNTVTLLDVLRTLWPSILMVAFILASLVAFHYYRLVSELRVGQPVGISNQDGVDPVTEAITATEKHILLPQGERPQVARVSDLAPLENIPFFGNALIGDQVLVYCKSSLSVLYSPSRDKVIEVSRTLVAGSCPK